MANVDTNPGATGRMDVIAAVRAIWAMSASPRLESFLTKTVTSDEQLLADVIATDIEERRARKLPCGLDVYLGVVPRAMELGSVRRVLLTGEFISRAPESVDVVRSELLIKFPNISDDIASVAAIAALIGTEGELTLPTHEPGDVLGKYRLDTLLGSGSFAHTWLAWDISLRRHVALKILDVNDNDVDATERVLGEARAAAALDHESIVRVHEAGRFDTGECYLDTQFVGELSPVSMSSGYGAEPTTRTLEALMADGKVEPMKAARLIAAIAWGVAAAHGRGITHRDIKPSNILLNSKGAPMLADFGLAQRDSKDEGTKKHRMAGTPAYIAPEIARGEAGTPLSDIFSLGCTLRALLTGEPPRKTASDGKKSSFVEVLTMAREQALASIGELAPGTPRTLVKICDRATAHEPKARYASAERFAADLQAFIDQCPTEADPVGAVGTALLWTQRHRVSALVATIAIGALIVMTLGFVTRLTIESNRARKAEQLAQQQRDEAIAAKNTIELMNRFVSRTFASTRGVKGTANFTVRDGIELAEARVGKTFADRPIVEASVRHFLGQAALGSGYYDLAKENLERALELRRKHLGDAHRDTIATLRQWSDLMSATGKRSEQDIALAEIIRLLGEEGAYANPDGLFALTVHGRKAITHGDLKEARRVLERVEQAYDQIPADGSGDQQQCLNGLVEVYGALKLWDDMERSQRKAFEINKRNMGMEDISTLGAYQAIGSVLREAGKKTEAEGVYRESLAGYRRVAGPDHTTTMNIELEVASLTESPDEALQLVQSVQQRSTKFNKGYILRIKSAVMLGPALEKAGKMEEAEAALREGVRYCTDAVGPTNKWTLEAERNLATFLKRKDTAH